MRTSIMLFWLASYTLSAQTAVKPQAIISSGKSFQLANAGVTFTVGEIVVKPMPNDSLLLSNGILAPTTPFIVTDVVSNTASIQFSLFPNPASQLVNLNLQSSTDQPVLISVSDVQGRQLTAQNLPRSNTNYSFSIHTWPAGLYVMQVYSQQNELLGYIKFQKQ